MAAYAATATLDQRSAAKLSNGGFKLLSGSVALSNYNSTPAEITGITKYFRGGAPRVVCDGVSSSGYLVRWSASDKALKAYYPSKAITPAGTVAVPVVTVTGGQSAGTALQITPDSTSGVLGKTTATNMAIPGATFGIGAQAFTGTAVTAQAGTEVANDVNVGTVNFIAFGI
jgi:hypothetical protein